MNTLPYFRLVTIAILTAFSSISAPAQQKKAPIVIREGSWVVEWVSKSHQCIVRFYNNQQQLIYEETVDRNLNIARRQTKQHLNAALEQAMFVWNATHKIPADRQWVAVQFEKK
jgi:hypothetical protein